MENLQTLLKKASNDLTETHYNTLYSYAANDIDLFWKEAAEKLCWEQKFTKVRAGKGSQQRWFTGGTINYHRNIFTDERRGSKKEALIILRAHGTRDVYTYEDLERKVGVLVKLLQKYGMCPGDTLITCTHKRDVQILLSLASLAMGVRFCHTFFKVPNTVLEANTQAAGARLVVYDGALRDETAPDFSSCSSVECVVSVEDILANAATQESDLTLGYVYQATDPAFYLFSSGSTGTPKVFATGHAGMVASAYVMYHLTTYVEDDSREYLGLDLAWGPAFILSVFLPLVCGKSIVISDEYFEFSNEDLVRRVRNERVAATTLPIATFTTSYFGTETLTLKKLFLTGMTLQPEVAKNIVRGTSTTELTTVYGYGSSEIGGLALFNFITGDPSDLAHKALYAYPGIMPKVTGSGELLLSNTMPSTCVGVVNDPVKYEQFWNDTGDFVTSDRVIKLNELQYRLVGRVDTLVKIKGRMLDLAVLSKTINEMLDDESVVVEQGGELWCFVVGAENTAVAAKIVKTVRNAFGSYAVPTIAFVAAIPRTAGGKVDRATLLTSVLTS